MRVAYGTFDLVLVFLSYLISVCGSYTALVFARESQRAKQEERLALIVWAGVVMGAVAIWSMHFVGMMALDLGMPASYEVGRTCLSMLLAIAATSVGFAVVGAVSRSGPAIVSAGVFMGLGIAAMHYTGMAALCVTAARWYDGPIVALSVAIAIAAATVALWMAFHLDRPWHLVVASLIAGFAVCGMHYTGMLALNLVPDPSLPDQLPTMLSPMVVGGGLSILSLVVLWLGHAMTRETRLETVDT
ncbi:MHYT domain-containing protein [Tahibacter soli]|uniref:MHYT domain-containing protein n=1 Tax=Tahibacter soli TaxID=2983605 RepID=A0A9X3YLZ5_9GAMM|nr:MHYT domain-containing protein [Tahibacter soli]MDC8013705.1 MHYT domain-containing protein [Tahibacter soli]